MFRRNCLILAGTLVVLASLLTPAGMAGDQESLWQTKFEDAKTKARAEKKLLLVDFSGSDWCGWCIKLKQEVFDQEVFKKEAPQKFVLVELDFPRQKQLPEELKTQNERLREQYQIRGYPTILVLDGEGQLIARTGYRPGGPEAYVKHLTEFVTVHEAILQMRAALAGSQGLDRAKLLDQLVEAYGKLGNDHADIKTWTPEIIALDPENKAGLKVKYEFRQFMAQATALKGERKFDEARAVFGKALALAGISGQMKQDAYFAEGECSFYLRDFVGVVASLKKGVEAAPEGSKVATLQAMLQRFGPLAEAQENVARVKGQLDQAQGLDRAKLLDQMIDARTKLAQAIPDQGLAQDVEQWSKEIVALDPENKGGLKNKYEVRVFLGEAQNLLRTQKFDEAHAALNKALAVPGLAGEQLQEVHVAKANGYFSQQNFEKARESCQEAIDAAPDSPRARMVKSLLQRAEGELAKLKAKEQVPAKEEPVAESTKPTAAK